MAEARVLGSDRTVGLQSDNSEFGCIAQARCRAKARPTVGGAKPTGLNRRCCPVASLLSGYRDGAPCLGSDAFVGPRLPFVGLQTS